MLQLEKVCTQQQRPGVANKKKYIPIATKRNGMQNLHGLKEYNKDSFTLVKDSLGQSSRLACMVYSLPLGQ